MASRRCVPNGRADWRSTNREPRPRFGGVFSLESVMPAKAKPSAQDQLKAAQEAFLSALNGAEGREAEKARVRLSQAVEHAQNAMKEKVDG